jgi:hypothetical protein
MIVANARATSKSCPTTRIAAIGSTPRGFAVSDVADIIVLHRSVPIHFVCQAIDKANIKAEVAQMGIIEPCARRSG